MASRAALTLLLLTLAGCGAAAQPSSRSPEVISTSATATPQPPTPAATATPLPSTATPVPTPTAGPVIYTLDFAAERKDDVTLHVGQALQLKLSAGPTSDWLSGVDDARVLRPMSPDGNGVYQAVTPGTALVTAHVPIGCASIAPNVPCRNPEHGFWFQTRVYVVP